MPAFTTEDDIRLRLQLNDTALAPQDFVLQCIEDAHDQVLRWLDENIDPESPPAALVYGETLIAAGVIFRALAAREAAAMRNMKIGEQSLNTERRFASRMTYAEELERQGWGVLEEFLAPRNSATLLLPSPTTPVLGEMG